MAMKMLQAGGLKVVTDGRREADESNPLGYFELERVLTLDKGGDTAWLRAARGKAVKIISALLPHLPETHNYKVVFMHRDLLEVIASQNTMLARGGGAAGAGAQDDERLRASYESHLAKIQNLLARRACFETLHVHYGEVVREPRAQAERIAAFLGRQLDTAGMAAAVDPSLHRNRSHPPSE
jgi:hypothetical protein